MNVHVSKAYRRLTKKEIAKQGHLVDVVVYQLSLGVTE